MNRKHRKEEPEDGREEREEREERKERGERGAEDATRTSPEVTRSSRYTSQTFFYWKKRPKEEFLLLYHTAAT